MAAQYQVEALLRPVVEGLSAVLAFAMAAAVYLLHSHLFMSESVAYSASAFFVVYGLWRSGQWIKVRKYQKRLTKLPRYAIKQKSIPQSKKQLFIGKGFAWGQKHTQRLRDCLLPENEDYFKDGLFYRIARTIENHVEGSFIARILSSDSVLNPVRPKPAVGGRPEIHGVGMYEGERNVSIPLYERVGHTLVLGTTRVGKTRLCELMVTQDIRRGETVIMFDPKGIGVRHTPKHTIAHSTPSLTQERRQ